MKLFFLKLLEDPEKRNIKSKYKFITKRLASLITKAVDDKENNGKLFLLCINII